MAATLQHFANQWGCVIVSWEYAGYGPRDSEYSSAESMRTDVIALYDHIHKEWNVDEGNLIIYGHSIGSGPAIWLASQRPCIGAVILQSPYTSIRNIVRDKFGWAVSLACPVIFDNATAIRSVGASILLIHGERDSLIPITHSEQLYTAAARCRVKRIIRCKMATHNDWDLIEDIINPIRAFLRTYE